MNKANPAHGNVVPLGTSIGDLCSIVTFATSSGLPVSEVVELVENGSMCAPLARCLEIAARCRLNVLISGGTGSGKTTLLNAMSRLIDHGERVVTVEDAAPRPPEFYKELIAEVPHLERVTVEVHSCPCPAEAQAGECPGGGHA